MTRCISVFNSQMSLSKSASYKPFIYTCKTTDNGNHSFTSPLRVMNPGINYASIQYLHERSGFSRGLIERHKACKVIVYIFFALLLRQRLKIYSRLVKRFKSYKFCHQHYLFGRKNYSRNSLKFGPKKNGYFVIFYMSIIEICRMVTTSVPNQSNILL